MGITQLTTPKDAIDQECQHEFKFDHWDYQATDGSGYYERSAISVCHKCGKVSQTDELEGCLL